MVFYHCSKVDHVTSQGGGDVVTTGKVYLPDGSYATNCVVTAVPSEAIPGSDLFTSVTTTDRHGQFVFKSLPANSYNLFSKEDNFASCIRFTKTGEIERQTLPDDTLKLTGGIEGIVNLSGSTDSRSVLILMIGGTVTSWPKDSSGSFSFSGLAQGTYKFRFLPLDYKYAILDTSITIISGESTKIDTIRLTIK